MKSKYEEWFMQQSFYLQLRFVLGDRIFDFDHGVGYRNLSVQIGYVAFCGRDVEFVLGGAQIAKNKPESVVNTTVGGGAQSDELIIGQRTSEQVVNQTTALAREFYAEMGYVQNRSNFRFYESQHPTERLMWQFACIAQMELTNTDPNDAISDLE